MCHRRAIQEWLERYWYEFNLFSKSQSPWLPQISMHSVHSWRSHKNLQNNLKKNFTLKTVIILQSDILNPSEVRSQVELTGKPRKKHLQFHILSCSTPRSVVFNAAITSTYRKLVMGLMHPSSMLHVILKWNSAMWRKKENLMVIMGMHESGRGSGHHLLATP